MNITQDEIIQMAYRLIRIETRRFDRTTTDSELANYVKGIVDFQTELLKREQNQVDENIAIV